MKRDEYWIGKDIDVGTIWKIYQDGVAYEESFLNTTSALLKLKFDNPSKDVPLFVHEALYKSVKAIYHDFKYDVFPESYESSKSIYLYEIKRGSFDISFLLDPDMIVNFVSVLCNAFEYYQNYKFKSSILEMLDKEQNMTAEQEENGYMFIKSGKVEATVNNVASLKIKQITAKKDFMGQDEIKIEFND